MLTSVYPSLYVGSKRPVEGIRQSAHTPRLLPSLNTSMLFLVLLSMFSTTTEAAPIQSNVCYPERENDDFQHGFSAIVHPSITLYAPQSLQTVHQQDMIKTFNTRLDLLRDDIFEIEHSKKTTDKKFNDVHKAIGNLSILLNRYTQGEFHNEEDAAADIEHTFSTIDELIQPDMNRKNERKELLTCDDYSGFVSYARFNVLHVVEIKEHNGWYTFFSKERYYNTVSPTTRLDLKLNSEKDLALGKVNSFTKVHASYAYDKHGYKSIPSNRQLAAERRDRMDRLHPKKDSKGKKTVNWVHLGLDLLDVSLNLYNYFSRARGSSDCSSLSAESIYADVICNTDESYCIDVSREGRLTAKGKLQAIKQMFGAGNDEAPVNMTTVDYIGLFLMFGLMITGAIMGGSAIINSKNKSNRSNSESKPKQFIRPPQDNKQEYVNPFQYLIQPNKNIDNRTPNKLKGASSVPVSIKVVPAPNPNPNPNLNNDQFRSHVPYPVSTFNSVDRARDVNTSTRSNTTFASGSGTSGSTITSSSVAALYMQQYKSNDEQDKPIGVSYTHLMAKQPSNSIRVEEVDLNSDSDSESVYIRVEEVDLNSDSDSEFVMDIGKGETVVNSKKRKIEDEEDSSSKVMKY